MKKIKLLTVALLLTCFILILFRFLVPPIHALSWDVFGYYLYLPAKYIYHDLTLENPDWLTSLLNTYQPTATFYQAVKLENGNWVLKYTMGLSILYAPFFFMAHFLANLLGYPADGLSLPYQYIITAGGLIYGLIGLYFFTKILKIFFNPVTSTVILLIICFATNYFQLTAFDGTLLSHNFLFTFYAILVYYTIQWHSLPRVRYAAGVGAVCGFITLIRPSEIVCVLIPLLWGIKDRTTLIEKISMMKSSWPGWILALASFVTMISPQLLYWKMLTGNWFFYSYTNSGEGLDLLSPHLFNFLFSFRKGWFVYTPVMVFAFIGFYYLRKNYSSAFLTILVFMLADIYVISSWTNWWYAGGSYSSRAILPSYVLLALPLGCFIDKMISMPQAYRIIAIAVGVFLTTLNLFQTWQFEKGIITKESMTMKYYFAIFGKTKVDEKNKNLLMINRSAGQEEVFNDEKNYIRKILYNDTFLNDSDTSGKDSSIYVLNNQNQFSPGPDVRYQDLTPCDHAWIRSAARIFIPENFTGEFPRLVVTFHHNGKPYKYIAKEMKSSAVIYNDWNNINVDYITPEVRSEDDNLKVYVWYAGKKDILLDELRVEVYEPIIPLSN